MTLNRSSLPIEIQKLIIAFSSLPGIGPKTAQRLTFYVLSQNIEETMKLSEALRDVKKTLSYCQNCFFITSEDNSSSCKYHYSDPSVIVTVDKEIKMPSIDVEVEFTEDNLKKVITAAGTLGVTDLVLTGQKDSTIQLKVKDKKNKASNDFAITIGSGASAFFEFYFKVENLKLLPGDYKVQVSSKGISYFTHKNLDVSYFIALEPESTYNS